MVISIQQPVKIQTAAAVTALLIGVFVYLLDRQAESVYFMSSWMALGDSMSPFFGTIGDQLPTFVHVYAFILLTMVVASPSRGYVLYICLFWLVLESLFELAQITVIAHWITSHIPEWFSGIPLLENTAAYFLGGTFDVVDLCSIAAGTLAAYLTIVISTQRNTRHG
jgi:hypothetical protein